MRAETRPILSTIEAIADSAGAPARLLLIDSEESTARNLAEPLQARLLAASALVEARTGRQALEVLRASEFDIVLADLESLADLSPKTDETVGKIARFAPGALLVVFLDAASVSTSIAIMRAGAHECVAKPVSGEALALKIGALALRLGRPRALGVEGPEMIAQSRAEGQPAVASVEIPPILPMWRQEQKIIEDAIRTFAGNVALAAAALELSPSTIYRKRQAWAEMGLKSA
ncbi:MAG TPA: helix-turn-helix domain-containing protein [Devosia sp.]|nr:helix-turn-helix domain-containing protein [Devosia sp.]